MPQEPLKFADIARLGTTHGPQNFRGLWLTWLPHGLVEASLLALREAASTTYNVLRPQAAPRLVVHARRITATAGGDEPGRKRRDAGGRRMLLSSCRLQKSLS